MTYQCKVCHNDFKRNGKKVPQTCSFACRDKSYLKISTFECEFCEVEIKGSVRELAGKSRFCSQKCTNNWKKEAYCGRKVEYSLVNCNYCNDEIERVPSKVNEKNYCNKSCKGKHIWEIRGLSEKMVWKPCWIFIDGEKMNFRSMWEAAFVVDFLQKYNLKWKYESRSFHLSDGSKYTPDFYIEDDDVYVEIKGYDRTKSTERFFKFRNEYVDENTIFANKDVLESVYGLNLRNAYLKSLCDEGQVSQ